MEEETFPEKSIEKAKRDWLKIISLSFIELFLLFIAFYSGYWYGVQRSAVETLKPVIPTPTPKQPTPTTLTTPTLKLESTIPANWKTYDKTFAETYFFFRYPETHEVWDFDQSSGEIYIIKEGAPNWPADVTIDNLLHIFYGFGPYQGGSRREWFRDNLQKLHPDTDLSTLAFQEVNFPNGKRYLKVYNWPNTSEFENGAYYQGDFYFGIQNGIAVYILDKGLLDRSDFLKILSSITASK